MLLGNVGQEVKEIAGGYAKFSMATSETFKNKKGEYDQSTQWHSVVVFNEHLAKYALNSFKKGTRVFVEGQIAYRDIMDKDGNKKSFVDVVVGRQRGDMKIINRNKEQEINHKQPSYNSDTVDKYFKT